MNNRTGLPKDPTETPEAHLVGYARVSGDGQHLDTQVDELLRHGVLLEDIWQEHASAADKERPAFAAMMRGLGRNDTLVIWKLDRIGRSMSAIKEAIDQIQANGAQLKVLAQPVDTAGPMGNLALHIIAAMADFELDLVRERTNRGLQAAR